MLQSLHSYSFCNVGRDFREVCRRLLTSRNIPGSRIVVAARTISPQHSSVRSQQRDRSFRGLLSQAFPFATAPLSKRIAGETSCLDMRRTSASSGLERRITSILDAARTRVLISIHSLVIQILYCDQVVSEHDTVSQQHGNAHTSKHHYSIPLNTERLFCFRPTNHFFLPPAQ